MRYTFGDCVFDTKSREFRRGGAEVHLSPKAHELLHLLIAQRPRVLSKGELMQALWPDTFVVEGNLPVIVAELRAAIGARPAVGAAVIRTHHGIGYSFTIQAQTSKSGLPQDPSSPRAVLKIGRRRVELGPGANEIGRDLEAIVLARAVRWHAERRILLEGQRTVILS